LFKEDIASNSVYVATLDQAGSYLYDKNDYAVYAQSEEHSKATLNFTGQNINQILA
jgi:hypothetical protein